MNFAQYLSKNENEVCFEDGSCVPARQEAGRDFAVLASSDPGGNRVVRPQRPEGWQSGGHGGIWFNELVRRLLMQTRQDPEGRKYIWKYGIPGEDLPYGNQSIRVPTPPPATPPARKRGGGQGEAKRS